MKGYKMLKSDMTTIYGSMTYEIGKTYKLEEEEEVNKSETDGTVTIPLKRYLELLRIEQGR